MASAGFPSMNLNIAYLNKGKNLEILYFLLLGWPVSEGQLEGIKKPTPRSVYSYPHTSSMASPNELNENFPLYQMLLSSTELMKYFKKQFSVLKK
jgi:hypothetical protein